MTKSSITKYKFLKYVAKTYICLIVLQFFQKFFFVRDLCLMRDDYTVFNNCAITKEELVF